MPPSICSSAIELRPMLMPIVGTREQVALQPRHRVLVVVRESRSRLRSGRGRRRSAPGSSVTSGRCCADAGRRTAAREHGTQQSKSHQHLRRTQVGIPERPELRSSTRRQAAAGRSGSTELGGRRDGSGVRRHGARSPPAGSGACRADGAARRCRAPSASTASRPDARARDPSAAASSAGAAGRDRRRPDSSSR